ncbi:MAG: metallophosphoesterase [Proteobacteria bacterium]|nr:metallophosphoesterase [Pseudomonadota bacterium]
MRIAVISDIHSNMEAFSAVLADIAIAGADRVVCLGDSIGYGPEPEQVILALKGHQIPSVMGNHERALVDENFLKSFNPQAKKALMINRQLMSQASIDHLSALPPFRVHQGARFVHGAPPDLVDRYIFKENTTRLSHTMEALKEKICFVGHTHELMVYEMAPGGVKKKNFTKSRVFLAKEYKYIINTGSVGQPRDGYNEAKYIVWDSAENTIEPRFVSYDIPKVIEKMKKAGIPIQYALLLQKAANRC